MKNVKLLNGECGGGGVRLAGGVGDIDWVPAADHLSWEQQTAPENVAQRRDQSQTGVRRREPDRSQRKAAGR